MESSVYSHGCTDLLLAVFKSSLIYISILAFAVGISEVSLCVFKETTLATIHSVEDMAIHCTTAYTVILILIF